MYNRFVAGALFGSVFSAASGYVAVSFGVTSANGIVIAIFVGAVSGVASLIGGAVQ